MKKYQRIHDYAVMLINKYGDQSLTLDNDEGKELWDFIWDVHRSTHEWILDD